MNTYICTLLYEIQFSTSSQVLKTEKWSHLHIFRPDISEYVNTKCCGKMFKEFNFLRKLHA